MKHPDSLILYVKNPPQSADFFHTLFEVPIVEQSPNFAMLALPGGTMLGLWASHDVRPKPLTGPGGFELLVTLENQAATDGAFAEARRLGVEVTQKPVTLDFGYTFVLRTGDGHLIRVFNPLPAPPAG
jgi:catechol 2,3-dioxygenase-like lactoylglutathione lyase family enzyme